MVDRTSEFANISSHLDLTNDKTTNNNCTSIIDINTIIVVSKRNSNNSSLSFAIKVHLNLDENEILIKKIQKLIKRKEFSNDATTLVNDLSENVHSKLSMIYKDMEILKIEIEKISSSYNYKNIQNKQHFEFILQYLHKIINEQLNNFKTLIKIRDHYLTERNKRVLKYGTSLKHTNNNDIKDYNKINNNMFAMDNYSDIQTYSIDNIDNYNTNSTTDLRNRKVNKHKNNNFLTNKTMQNNNQKSTITTSDSIQSNISSHHHQYNNNNNNSHHNSNNNQQQQSKVIYHNTNNTIRVKQTQQVESSILQMGKLFSQMATLVSAQNEIILRIEDDVETGLNDTLEAQTHLEKVYNITKSNRYIIIKVLLLLVLFIFLFLMWT